MEQSTSPGSTTIEGRCLCGAVRFRLSPPTDFVAHCHCSSCRLSHGAAFVTWTSVPAERFAFETGEATVGWYRSSKWVAWGFCRTCGSSMLYRALEAGHHESPKLDRIYVTAGSLVSPLDRAPAAHVSYEEHLPWVRVPDGLPKHRGKTDETLPE
ncbi:MAG: GFA family protein [Deltaproteobacteria bacterium]|nr:GFA family protein [Deltaproteobacteria bacterium]